MKGISCFTSEHPVIVILKIEMSKCFPVLKIIINVVILVNVKMFVKVERFLTVKVFFNVTMSLNGEIFLML